jgi:transposase-like protein
VVARFRTSGLSVRAFCRREKLQESAFYFWRRTLVDRDGEVPTKPRPTSKRAANPAFLPVTIRHDILPPTSALTLELPRGGVLRFSESMPVEHVAALIRALEAAT